MTIRYATLASPTLRAAYDEQGQDAKAVHPTPAGKPIIPDKVSWLNSECSRPECTRLLFRARAAGAARADICDTCDNSVTGPESHRTPRPAHRRHRLHADRDPAAGTAKPPGTPALPAHATTPCPTRTLTSNNPCPVALPARAG